MAKRGRPALSKDAPSTYICLKVEPDLYDRTFQAARDARISVPEAIRRVMRREFRNLKSTSSKTSANL